MPLNQHRCIFYECADDLWNLCVPLIRDSAQAGFKWLYVADENDFDDVPAALKSRLQPLPVGEVVHADTLSLLGTPLSITAVIDQLRTRAQMALDEGFYGLFLLTEMTW